MDKMEVSSQDSQLSEVDPMSQCPSQEPSSQTDSEAGSKNGPAAASAKDVVVKMLDEMDDRVEKLRANALTLDSERDDILSTLDTIANAQLTFELEGIDKDEVDRYVERLVRRCAAVQIEIKTERSSPQLESLSKVNCMIDDLIKEIEEDAASTLRRCVTYLNACSEEMTHGVPEIDSKFEGAVLGCSIEDQKRVKKRLQGLYSYINSKAFSVQEQTDKPSEERQQGLKSN